MKVERNLEDFLGCKIRKTEEGFEISQSRVIEDFVRRTNFKLTSKVHKIPSAPGFTVIHANKELDTVLNDQEQKIYQSGIGTLLYLVKHSRPDLLNCTRELSKAMDVATPGQFKELKRVSNYVIQTKELNLKIMPEERKNEKIELDIFQTVIIVLTNQIKEV